LPACNSSRLHFICCCPIMVLNPRKTTLHYWLIGLLPVSARLHTIWLLRW
jgi:hypothetical protein